MDDLLDPQTLISVAGGVLIFAGVLLILLVLTALVSRNRR